jgi:hypothetical protein
MDYFVFEKLNGLAFGVTYIDYAMGRNFARICSHGATTKIYRAKSSCTSVAQVSIERSAGSPLTIPRYTRPRARSRSQNFPNPSPSSPHSSLRGQVPRETKAIPPSFFFDRQSHHLGPTRRRTNYKHRVRLPTLLPWTSRHSPHPPSKVSYKPTHLSHVCSPDWYPQRPSLLESFVSFRP